MKRCVLHAILILLPVVAGAQDLSSLDERAPRLVPEPRPLPSAEAGAVVEFSRAYEKRGYWLPQLYRHLGANLCFLTPMTPPCRRTRANPRRNENLFERKGHAVPTGIEHF
jgi:hypothetical protein